MMRRRALLAASAGETNGGSKIVNDIRLIPSFVQSSGFYVLWNSYYILASDVSVVIGLSNNDEATIILSKGQTRGKIYVADKHTNITLLSYEPQEDVKYRYNITVSD